MSQTLTLRPRRRIIEGSLFDDLKLKKEEVIYRRFGLYKYSVLPFHTAYTSRASARDHVTHVTWNGMPEP